MIEKIFLSIIFTTPVMIAYYIGEFTKINSLFCVYIMQIFLFRTIKENNISKINGIFFLKIIFAIIIILILEKIKIEIIKFFKIISKKQIDMFFLKTQRHKSFVQNIFSIFPGIFLPLIPLFLLRSILVEVSHLKGLEILNDFGEVILYFLPVYIGITAAKELKLNLLLSSWLGIFLILYSFIYIGSVFPMLLTMLVISIVRDNIILKIGTIVFFPILGLKIGEVISLGIVSIFNQIGILAGAVLGASYSPFVATGLHQGIVAVEMNLLQKYGYDFLLPIWAMADISQGGSAIAVAVKSKSLTEKKFAFMAGLASIWGISEAAMFGINLKYIMPFIIACISAGIAGIYITFTSVVTTGIGLSGLPGIILVRNDKIYSFIIGCLISFSISFCTTLLLYRNIKNKKDGSL